MSNTTIAYCIEHDRTCAKKNMKVIICRALQENVARGTPVNIYTTGREFVMTLYCRTDDPVTTFDNYVPVI